MTPLIYRVNTPESLEENELAAANISLFDGWRSVGDDLNFSQNALTPEVPPALSNVKVLPSGSVHESSYSLTKHPLFGIVNLFHSIKSEIGESSLKSNIIEFSKLSQPSVGASGR